VAAATASRSDRELAAALRAELAAIEPTRACCRSAERAGLGAAATGRAHTPAVARLAVRLGHGAALAPFDWEGAADHCRLSYLRGLFLARASLSLGPSRTHLEFVVDPAEAPPLAARLGEMGLPASWRVRRRKGVVTWKSADRVAGFLGALGAGPSLLELQSRAVTRTLHGELNRLFNADGANLGRAVDASSRQIAAIVRLESAGRLEAERETIRALAGARRRAPEATLAELAAEVGITRSAAQRGLERIERIAAEDGGSPTRPG